MNNNLPEILNPLQHSGTNRFQRLSNELAFDFVKIEERHEADFLTYAAKLASTIQYYDQQNMPAGTWQSFFDDNVPTNRPHKALFIAFLRLLEALNEHANGLTKRHLDFYYRDVLQFVAREAKPSHIHLFFTCLKSLNERFVEEGTEFLAGETQDGKKIIFKLVDELVVNRTKLVHFYSLFKHSDSFDNRLFSKDYSGLLTADSIKNKMGFPLFGERQLTYVKNQLGDYELGLRTDFTMDDAEIGFAVSSSMLRMSEGEREIQLTLFLDGSDQLSFNPSQFQFSFTSAKGWMTLNPFKVTGTKGQLEFIIKVKNTDSGILDYDVKQHGGAYNTAYPVLRILLNSNHNTDYAYLKWKAVKLTDAKLKVKASNVRSLIVQNEQSTLDPSKPFRPFGPLPTFGSHFYIGHPHIFDNKILKAAVQIDWKNIGSSQFSAYYANYSVPISNADFLVETSILEDKVWGYKNTGVLFNQDALLPQTIHIGFSPAYTRKPNNEQAIQWDYAVKHGFVRMTLSGVNKPSFQAFGHQSYAKELTRINQLNRALDPSLPPYEINQPYTPVIERLTLTYETEELSLKESIDDSFYHVTAYGQHELILGSSLVVNKLLPEYKYEAEFYLGLQDLVTPQSVSFLFNLLDGTADADQSSIKSGIKWFYLVGNVWKALDPLRISKDTTRNLLNTGIIRFDLPADMDVQHEIMPNGLFWLKAIIPESSAGLDRVQSIHLHAGELVEVEPGLSDQVVPPKTVSKFRFGGSGIDELVQPYASFGGTTKGDEELFYTQVLERLRHKDRAIMIWDYERLVLDQFTELYKVKCLNHTNYQTEMAAGHVMVAVIPNLRRKGINSPFQPKLSIHKRMEIYDHLRERISPFIYLRVENPIYEPIQLSFNVGFHKGRDEGFYGKKLHQQLQEFLSPWAFENSFTEKSDLVFGGELHKSIVLKFIEELEYVDFVNDFNLYHIYQDPAIATYFSKRITAGTFTLNDTNCLIHHSLDGPCDLFTIKFDVDNQSDPTVLIELKVRFLRGLIELNNEFIEEKFARELCGLIKRRVAQGQPLTKTLVRILVKNIYYVDRVVSLQFYKELPNDYVMEDVDVAVAKTARSIMVTSEQHRIGVYRAGDYNCEGSVVIGIGFMIVEADFIIPQIKQENYEYNAR